MVDEALAETSSVACHYCGAEMRLRSSAEAARGRVVDGARALIERLLRMDPRRAAEEIAPRPEDFARVFVDEIADAAREGFARTWAGEVLAPHANPGQTELLVAAATGEELARGTKWLQEFPGGYQSIAGRFRPDVYVVRWKHVRPGATSGLAYDGLVPLDARWAWFPKPWRWVPAGA